MDIISHGIWGSTIIRRPKMVILAFISGTLPDLASTVAGFLYLQFSKGPTLAFNWNTLPAWSTYLYSFTHSLLGLSIFSVLLIVLARRYLLLIIPYALHLLLDLFTHAGDPLERLFYPWIKYNSARAWGFNWWEHPWTSLLNWGVILIINIGLFAYYRHKRSQKQT